MIGIFNNFVEFFIAFPNEFRPSEKSLYYGLVIEIVFVYTHVRNIYINNECGNHQKNCNDFPICNWSEGKYTINNVYSVHFET